MVIHLGAVIRPEIARVAQARAANSLNRSWNRLATLMEVFKSTEDHLSAQSIALPDSHRIARDPVMLTLSLESLGGRSSLALSSGISLRTHHY